MNVNIREVWVTWALLDSARKIGQIYLEVQICMSIISENNKLQLLGSNGTKIYGRD